MNAKMTGAQDMEETIQQLQASGVLFCVQYVGSVLVEKSINSLSPERQAEVARACMRFVVQKVVPSLRLAGLDENEASSISYVHGPVQPHKREVEMNISSSAIILIDGNPMHPLHRFKIQDVSLLSPGFDELASFFCFFAKMQVPGQPRQWLRKCFVFNAKSEMEDVRDAICFAFRLNEHNNSQISERDEENTLRVDCASSGGECGTGTPPAVAVICQEENKPGTSTSLAPEIQIVEGEVALDVPPRPRRYTSGNGAMEAGGGKGENTLMPAQRQCRSGTMDSGTRPSSISPRDNSGGSSTSVQVSPGRYKELTRDLNNQSWFHGILPRLKADSLIRMNGQFLVRQSPNIADQFVLVGMYDERVRHVCLVSKEGKIQTTIGEFKNIVDLIKYFHHSRSPMMLHGEQLQLHYPVNRERPA